MDADTVKWAGGIGMAVIGFFLKHLHGKVDAAASKEDMEKLRAETRVDIDARRRIEEKLFDELGKHVQEDTRRFEVVQRQMSDNHSELLKAVGGMK